MKSFSLLFLLLIVSAELSFAGAVTSGGTLPPPEYPKHFQYNCHARVMQTQANMYTRFSGSIEANTLLQHGLNTSNPSIYNGVVDLKNLSWQTTTANEPHVETLEAKPNSHYFRLEFEKTETGFKSLLRLNVSQRSESGLYTLNAYKLAEGHFKLGETLTVEANIEERAEWINNQPPKGLSMNYTSVQVTCLRTH